MLNSNYATKKTNQGKKKTTSKAPRIKCNDKGARPYRIGQPIRNCDRQIYVLLIVVVLHIYKCNPLTMD